MFLTLEVRWFYRGSLPGQLVDWLAARACLPPAQPARQDHYLRLEGQTTLGTKLREGHIEVKRRLGEAREVEMGPRAAGLLAPWRKWSFPLAPREIAGADPLEQLLVPASAWIAVEKQRRLQRYRLEGPTDAAPVGATAPAGLACEFELSQVQVGGDSWWSACFEASGQSSGLQHILWVVAAKILGPGWPLSLDLEHSHSYPSWLEHFASAGKH